MKKIIGFVLVAAIAGVSYLFLQPDNDKVDSFETMADFPCHQMGGEWMGQCEFDENGNVILDSNNEGALPEGERYETGVENLPYAKEPIVVTLLDGDTFDLEASFVKQEVGGRTLRRLAYNGMIPGPIFQVEQDSEITLNFTNNIDEETTIHSHGLRHDYTMDGVPDAPYPAIEPGESFSYTLNFPDAGVFWYHPHTREDRQQDLGLYGNYLVSSTESDYWVEGLNQSTWILDDLSLEEYLQDKSTHVIMGRFGDVQLLNNDENFQTEAKAGEIQRYFVTNTANTRPFRLRIDGAKMKVVGGDIGRVEKEYFVADEGLMIAPAERFIVEVYYPEIGSYTIENSTPDGVTVLGEVNVSEKMTVDAFNQFNLLRDNSSDYKEIRNFIEEKKGQISTKKLRIDIDMPAMDMGHGDHGHGHNAAKIEWNDQMLAMNRMSTDEEVTWKLIDEDTGLVNEEIAWKFEEGERVLIEIYNDPNSMHPMQHPIHFHGQRFLVLDRDGKENEYLQWKDTALLETGEKITILLDNTTPGVWMAHCHISEHLHTGMMFNFTVGDFDISETNHNH